MMWSAAMTDIMVLKLKASEAARYALWESTVFKPPAQINTEVNQKFVDLRSPRDVNISYTGLLMYPLSKDMMWAAAVDTTSTKVSIGGNAKMPTGTGIEKYIGIVMSGLSRAVDSEMKRERFNVNGLAIARARLVHARHDEQVSPILKGGDLLGLKGGNDLDHNKSMTNFAFQAPLPSQRPMELVFDTWKAWQGQGPHQHRRLADADVSGGRGSRQRAGERHRLLRAQPAGLVQRGARGGKLRRPRAGADGGRQPARRLLG